VPEPVDRRFEAPLARDLRLLVRERIAAGDSNSQVIDFLVARYGEFVLLKPRFTPHTVLLWPPTTARVDRRRTGVMVLQPPPARTPAPPPTPRSCT
jgi:cytochrome c-type biogenesis protein CcmH/NrfF